MRVVVVVLLGLFAAFPVTAATAPAPHGEIGDLVHRFFRHYANGDVAALMELWGPPSDASRKFRAQLEGTLRVRCLTLDGLAVDRIDVNAGGDEAVVDARPGLTKRWREEPARFTSYALNVRMRLRREDGAWRVTAFALREDELAERLLAAASAEERSRILAGNPDLLTVALVRELYRRGLDLSNSTKFWTAQHAADVALEMARQTGDRGGEALAVGLQGIVARMSGERDRAMALSNASLHIAEETGDPDVLARAWRNLNRVHDQFDAAGDASLECLLRAEAAARDGEDPFMRVRIVEGLGLVYKYRTDFFRARAYLDEAMRFGAEIGDLHSQVGGPIFLSQIYRTQENWDVALYHAEQAVQLAEKTGHWSLGPALHEVGNVHVMRGDLARAKPLLERAVRELTATRNFETLAFTRSTLAVLYGAEGDIDLAECMARETSKAREAFGYTAGPDLEEAAALPALQRGQYRRALALALERASQATAVAPAPMINSLRVAGKALRKLGYPEQALKMFEESIEIQDELLNRLTGDDQQILISTEQIALAYREIIDLHLESGRVDDALAAAEEGKGRVLLAILHGRKRGQQQELASEDRRREHEMQQRLARLNRRLDEANAARDTAQAAQLRREIEHARIGYASFRDGARSRMRRLEYDRGSVHIASPGEIRRRMPADLAFLQFVVTDERTHVFAVTAGGVAVRSLPIGRSDLERKVESFVGKLSTRNLKFHAEARELFDALLAPLHGELSGVSAICILPDGALWRLPFAALAGGDGRYAVERWSVFYAPSISTWLAMSEEAPSPEGRERTLLSFADPHLSHRSRADMESYYRGTDLGPLPHAVAEAHALRALYGPARSAVFTGSEATEARAKANASDYRVLHFATHAIFDNHHPMYSRLLLSPDAKSADDDGYLEPWEIAKMDLRADVAVLSACETARGKIGAGEGVIGMTWAFFVAGARSTVASQWKVASESTAELMVAFHRALVAGRSDSPLRKAEALRRAQLELIRGRRYSHPFYWSAFVLMGSAR